MFVYQRVKDRPMGQENQSLTRSRPIVWGNHFEPRPNGLWVKSFQVQRVVKRSQTNQPRCDALLLCTFFDGKICPWYPIKSPWCLHGRFLGWPSISLPLSRKLRGHSKVAALAYSAVKDCGSWVVQWHVLANCRVEVEFHGQLKWWLGMYIIY